MQSYKSDLYDTIYILRHGQRADKVHEPGVTFENKDDPPMTEIGRKQCYASAKYIQNQILNRNQSQQGKLEVKVYSSPFLRCIQSSEEVCRMFNINQFKVDTRLSENQATFYYDKDPLPNLILHDPKQLKKFQNQSLELQWNSNWYEEGRSLINYPDSSRTLKARFVSILEEIIQDEFNQNAQENLDNPKTVIMVSHGCAIEQLCEHFGGRWQFEEEYCAILGFLRKKGEEDWVQIEAGKAYYSTYLEK
ncbi:UNKNOWN [Stylonychia lemnae]|uniref:Phosphoglycerate mutase family protein n=1 Tax=Stylonychia lemnae TaxID=5949 RepID=A0A078BAL4_STYLE|nr:UNKNOWN [Stylonychia lemnae]|eukprot:CDW91389.1 UNKNOWN [Stylonychia lemnae]